MRGWILADMAKSKSIHRALMIPQILPEHVGDLVGGGGLGGG